ncbi:tRNA (N(6)-L-threonylcarbamoyladenosine(37)-C(2))-methylthiotransferase MtaB [Paracoccaceae bacterium]|nr:tRNA (N(6)-L-threonylcarbamoyladenosine(37)-C(2))-methylthiotransferase MtaB [Paracoccaceae bacterium]
MKFKTLGCRLNTFETETIKSITEKLDFKNLTFVNTCSVTKEAAKNSKKYVRQLKKSSPNNRVIVSGCDSHIEKETYMNMPEVDVVVGNNVKLNEAIWRDIVKSNRSGFFGASKLKFKKEKTNILPNFTKRSRAYLEIQNGCDHSCTFCIIPQGRGISKSVATDTILEKASSLVDKGFKEIVLTGVDITSWGSDLDSSDQLGDLVIKILDEIPKLPRLRLSSLDVSEMDDSLLDVFKTNKRMMPHLHLSLQSGNNLILKRMKRRHSREQAIDLCKNLKASRPELTFGADLIAGFPTESDIMFLDTIKLVDECDISWLHIFPYSGRPNTPASRMPQVSKHEISKRSKALRDLAQRKKIQHFAKLKDKTLSVLMESEYKGRAEDFTEITTNTPLKIGEIYPLKVQNYCADSLVAKTLKR